MFFAWNKYKKGGEIIGGQVTAWRSGCTFTCLYMTGLILGGTPDVSIIKAFDKAVKEGAVRGSDAYVNSQADVLKALGMNASVSGYIKTGKWTKDGYPAPSAQALNEMFKLFNEGGVVHARVSNDPNGQKCHSVIFHGWEMVNGELYIKVFDPAGITKSNEYYNPRTNELCVYDSKNGRMDYTRSDKKLMKYNYIKRKK